MLTPKKSPAKKSPAKKSPAKKSPAKKSPAKKSPAKKSPVKKLGGIDKRLVYGGLGAIGLGAAGYGAYKYRHKLKPAYTKAGVMFQTRVVPKYNDLYGKSKGAYEKLFKPRRKSSEQNINPLGGY